MKQERKDCVDYRKYSLSFTEYGKVVLLSIGITLCVAYLFFSNGYVLLLTPFTGAAVYHHIRRQGLKKQIDELSAQFLDAMRVVSTALLAGYSMENAWKEAQKETGLLYGENAMFYLELQEINHSVELNIPLEHLLESFAERSGIEDIISFSEVFAFAKRCGGDFAEIIEATTNHMYQKQEIEREIDVLVAGRRMEQKIMNLIPLLILAYLRFTSGDYLSVLYHNPIGILFMCGCLLIYLAAFYLAEKILTIHV